MLKPRILAATALLLSAVALHSHPASAQNLGPHPQLIPSHSAVAARQPKLVEESDGGETLAAAKPPFDLGAVRRLKVAGTLLAETPRRAGDQDLLAPLPMELPSLGISIERASAPTGPGATALPTGATLYQIYAPHSRPVVLAVGYATAYINNVARPLRAAPVLRDNRLWLPLLSIAPLIGAATRLEPDGTLDLNPTVQSVELFSVHNQVALTIKTSAPLPADAVRMGTLDDPPKLYFDIPNFAMGFDAANTSTERAVSTGLGDVKGVRAGQFQKSPDITRIVLDLKRPFTAVTEALPDRSVYGVVLVPSGAGNGTMAETASLNSQSAGQLRGLTIVLDAGHGGYDFGARGARSDEKTHTLDIVRRLRAALVARGANVLLTRDNDYFVTLQGRVDFANTRKADIFFSVHINCFLPSSAGTETYYFTPQSLNLAREVHKQLVQATGLKDRGIIRERFYVIRNTSMPSVLTESCFISNPAEEALLLKPAFRDRVAQGMAQGIANYAARYLRVGGVAG